MALLVRISLKTWSCVFEVFLPAESKLITRDVSQMIFTGDGVDTRIWWIIRLNVRTLKIPFRLQKLKFWLPEGDSRLHKLLSNRLDLRNLIWLAELNSILFQIRRQCRLIRWITPLLMTLCWDATKGVAPAILSSRGKLGEIHSLVELSPPLPPERFRR